MRALLSFALLVLPAAAIHADESLRCGNWVVALPVTVEELVAKCGEPAAKEVSSEDVRVPGKGGTGSRVIGTTQSETWTYQPSSQSLPMVVSIRDGKVVRIARSR